MSELDKPEHYQPADPDANVQNMLVDELQDMAKHTCLQQLQQSPLVVQGDERSVHLSYEAIMAICVYFINGYGVKACQKKALEWMAKGAQYGIAAFQAGIAAISIKSSIALSSGLPIRKWMITGILVHNSDPAIWALGKIDLCLLQASRRLRSKMYNGISTHMSNVVFELESSVKALEQSALFGSSLVYQEATPDGLELIPDENEDGGDRNSILHHGCSSWREPLGVIQNLCTKYSALLKTRNTKGETPLLLACKSKRVKTVELLLELGANVVTPSYRLVTPLHYLALVADTDALVDHFINRGANVNAYCESLSDTLAHLPLSNSSQLRKRLARRYSVTLGDRRPSIRYGQDAAFQRCKDRP